MLNYKIVGGAAVESGGEVVQPLVGETSVNRVHNGDLLVEDDVGVVRHSVGHVILTLEKVNLAVVYTYIFYVFGNIHFVNSFLFGFQKYYTPKKSICK